jgi:hypothetical protein
MKLLSKQRDGRKISYRYDPAKTPWQRLLLSGILPAGKQHELNAVAQSLDPLRLLHQLEQLQKALFRCAVEGNPFGSNASSWPMRVFSVEQCTTELGPVEGNVPDPPDGLPALYQEQEKRKRVLGWRRTHKDPFKGEWERIISWLMANPERSSGNIFRELQRRSPGRSQPLQIRTLQRGMRNIRTHLLQTLEEHWQEEVIRGPLPSPVSAEGPPAYLDRCQLSKPPG